jgi:hypothetical protein
MTVIGSRFTISHEHGNPTPLPHPHTRQIFLLPHLQLLVIFAGSGFG